MDKRSLPLVAHKLRVREYKRPTVDPIADAAIISEKVKRSSCFGATVAGIVLMAVAVWGFIAAVLS